MGQFFILHSKVQQEYNSLLANALNRMLKAICPWTISNVCLQKWSFHAFEILYPVLKNASEMDTPF